VLSKIIELFVFSKREEEEKQKMNEFCLCKNYISRIKSQNTFRSKSLEGKKVNKIHISHFLLRLF